MPGFSHDGVGDPLAQLSCSELAVGVGQFEPQCPRGIEPAGRYHGRDAAGQSDLFGNAAADLAGMYIGSELFADLGLGEPHRFRGLQRRRHGPQLLQPRNPINPIRIRGWAVISDRLGKVGQHLIQAQHQAIRGRRLGLDC